MRDASIRFALGGLDGGYLGFNSGLYLRRRAGRRRERELVYHDAVDLHGGRQGLLSHTLEFSLLSAVDFFRRKPRCCLTDCLADRIAEKAVCKSAQIVTAELDVEMGTVWAGRWYETATSPVK